MENIKSDIHKRVNVKLSGFILDLSPSGEDLANVSKWSVGFNLLRSCSIFYCYACFRVCFISAERFKKLVCVYVLVCWLTNAC